MGYNFTLRLAIRIAFIALTSFAASAYFYSAKYEAFGIIAALSALQIILLIKFINRSNKQVTDFVKGINYADYTQNIKFDRLGGNFAELAGEMEKLVNKIKDARFEKEEYLRYLQTIVEHIGIGLISFDADGRVEIMNKGAKKILKVQHLQNISSLDDFHKGLGTYFFQITPGQKGLFKLSIGTEDIQLMVQGTGFRMKNDSHKLISFYNILAELEENEIEAWQKLTRVLTHEIMNSTAPISSLTSTALELLGNNSKNMPQDILKDINDALDTIRKRSDGLTAFVNKFRDISKIYKPNLQTIKVGELFYNVRLLTAQNLASNNIRISASVEPEEMELIADPNLFIQVIINLIYNSVQAIGESKEGIIGLSAQINDQGKALIQVSDNGPGISPNLLDKIFIPFFTTKSNGSGIGLSISQSIIRAHGGTIRVRSNEGSGTVFSITL